MDVTIPEVVLTLTNGLRGFSIPTPGGRRMDVKQLRVTLDFTGNVVIDHCVTETVWTEVTIGDFEDGALDLERKIVRLDLPALEQQLAQVALLLRWTPAEDDQAPDAAA